MKQMLIVIKETYLRQVKSWSFGSPSRTTLLIYIIG